MKPRRLAAWTIAVALLAGCRSAPAPMAFWTRTDLDPDRWDRALCRLGAYPEDLDTAALARARRDDLEAAYGGMAIPLAFTRALGERSAFDARCAAWRRPPATAGLAAAAEERPAAP